MMWLILCLQSRLLAGMQVYRGWSSRNEIGCKRWAYLQCTQRQICDHLLIGELVAVCCLDYSCNSAPV